MSSYAKNLAGAVNAKKTPQLEVIPGREAEMAVNNAGGFVFTVSPWTMLDRFLVLGTEGGTYYAGEAKMTKENAQSVIDLIKVDGVKVVARVTEISDSGRAPKNDPALFVLALASAFGDDATRKAAFAALPKVARIGTHLFHYAMFVDGMRGWGRGLRNAIGNWYQAQPVEKLANQLIKYQQRDGWSNRDLLRLSHPKTADAARDSLYAWATKSFTDMPVEKLDHLPSLVTAAEEAKRATDVKTIVDLIETHNLPREAIPTNFLNEKKVWEALLPNMPMTAMIRNLAKMTSIGLLDPLTPEAGTVMSKLGSADALKKARVHPIAVLSALMTYSRGRGVKGSLTWTPNQRIVDALDSAFYTTFGNVTPTHKSTLLALDVSGSMNFEEIAGCPGLTPRVASAAMALITMNVESNYEVVGFTPGGFSAPGGSRGWGGSSVKSLAISPKMRLMDVVSYMNTLGFSGTDCALPMLYAEANKLAVDSFSVYTDNETYFGSIHPTQALKQYRQSSGRDARLAVVGMTATKFTIADPTDSGQLDVVGFDSSAPQIMSDFFSGN